MSEKYKDKGQHQWHSVAEIEPAESPKQTGVRGVDLSGIKDAYKDGWNDAIENLHDDEAEEWAWDRVGSYLAHLQFPAESEEKP